MKGWLLVSSATIAGSVAVLVALVSCGSGRRGDDANAANAGDPARDPDAGAGVIGDLDASIDAAPPPAVGWVKGKVVAPEGTVPVSHAIVYLTKHQPPPVPTGAQCDDCVHLAYDEGYDYSKSDGTFEVPVYATGHQYLVVQKGQFRRVREVDVAAGDQSPPPDFTRLPGKNDLAHGDTIPRIGMVVGGYDKIEYSMKKLGIEEFYRYGDAPISLPGQGTPPGIGTGKSGNVLMTSPQELSQYAIALLPCAALTYTHDDNSGQNVCGAPSGPMKTAFKQYVQSGGKLYVTDYAYEAVRQTWPGFVTWYDATMNPLTTTSQGVGTGCRGGAETTTGVAEDPDLKDWMNAIGHKSFDLEKSWTRIEGVASQPGVDEKGQPTTIAPKVWISSKLDNGVKLPATVSFEDKCGRVLFSTYHCEGDDNSTLLAQEKALLYVLLEVSVCVGKMPPPPPPR